MLSEWSLLLTDQCLQWALINTHYRYVGHPYSNLPACRLHPKPATLNYLIRDEMILSRIK
jgi:hypothetical protein